MHTKFYPNTAFFPRKGDHLMKSISQNLWGRAEAAVQYHKICSCVAVLNSPCCFLSPQEAKTHMVRTELT